MTFYLTFFAVITALGMLIHYGASAIFKTKGDFAFAERETGKLLKKSPQEKHSLFGYNPVKLADTIYCVLAGTAFFYISSIRKNVGSDYMLYAEWYRELRGKTITGAAYFHKEKGWTIPAWIFGQVEILPVLMFTFFAAIIAILLTFYFARHSSLPWLSFASFIGLGYFMLSIHFVRQMIAALACAFAIHAIYRNRPIRFVVLVFFASCFHISAFLLLPFYFVLKIKQTPLILTIYSFLTLILFIFSKQFFSFVLKFVYTSYSNIEQNEFMNQGTTTLFSGSFFLLYFLCYLFKEQLIARSKFNEILLNCLFFAGFFEFIGSHHAIISRLVMYFFLPGVALLIPELVFSIRDYFKSYSRKNTKNSTPISIFKYGLYIGVFSYIFATYIFLINDNYGKTVPFKTIYGTEFSRSLYSFAEQEKFDLVA